MDDQPDVGFVYAHSKGYGRHNDRRFVMGKFFLSLSADGVFQPGMVRQSFQTVLGKFRCQFFGVFPEKRYMIAGSSLCFSSSDSRALKASLLGWTR
jgi:hypothetical protein